MSRKNKKSAYLYPEVDEIIEAARKEAEGEINSPNPSGWKAGVQEVKIGTWNGTGYTSTNATHYHYGDELIFSADGKHIYGGKVNDVELYGSDCFIDLAGAPSSAMEKFIKSAPERYKELNDMVKLPEVIRLMWKDYSYPNIGMAFWKKLWSLLPQGKIIVACMGGHGRTGTCTAALMLAAEVCSAEDAIEHVRTVYCPKAIETKGQEQYLVDLEKGFYNF